MEITARDIQRLMARLLSFTHAVGNPDDPSDPVRGTSSASLHQIRRWGVASCEPDPHTGKGSGKVRLFSLPDVINICICGILVSKMNFKLREAARILEDILGWLQHQSISLHELMKNRIIVINIIPLRHEDNSFLYEAKEMLGFHMVPDPDYQDGEEKAIVTESYRLKRFGRSANLNEAAVTYYQLRISDIIKDVGLKAKDI